MSQPFIGEIRAFGFNFAPRFWALCDGQLLPIAQNQALFSILGTTYGGDGRETFGLPDLRGRVPVHAGAGAVPRLGQRSGTETVTLTAEQLPAHGHAVMASADLSTAATPEGNVMGAKPRGGADVYAAGGTLTPLAPGAVSTAGSGQAHDNMQPFQVLNFCICLQGLFPSRS